MRWVCLSQWHASKCLANSSVISFFVHGSCILTCRRCSCSWINACEQHQTDTLAHCKATVAYCPLVVNCTALESAGHKGAERVVQIPRQLICCCSASHGSPGPQVASSQVRPCRTCGPVLSLAAALARSVCAITDDMMIALRATLSCHQALCAAAFIVLRTVAHTLPACHLRLVWLCSYDINLTPDKRKALLHEEVALLEALQAVWPMPRNQGI